LKRPDSANLKAGLVQALAGQGDCWESDEMAWELREKRAMNAPVARAVAGCFARIDAFGEAVYWQEFSLAVGEHEAEHWTRLALYQFRQGDDVSAHRSLEASEQLEPMNWRGGLVRAMVATGRGHWEEAERLLQELDRLAGSDLQIRWIVAAQISLDLGDLSQALEELEWAAQFKSRSPNLMALRAETYRRTGWLGDARRASMARAPANMSSLGFRLAIARVEADSGEVGVALPIVLAALEVAPAMPSVLSTAWYVSLVAGREELAREYARRYHLVQTSPLRQLQNLVPSTTGRFR
jgi:tetratricopeptide (TPR) repeat protein